MNALIRRTDLPFVALRVEQLTSQQSADYWTGIVSFAVGAGAILSGVIIGRLVDRIPPPRLILPILFGTGVFTLLQGVFDNLWLFMGSRTLCYFIAGAIQPLLQKLLTIQTPRDKRGLAFGIATTAFAVGGILASTIGGAVMNIGGISAVFIVGGAFAFLSTPLFLPVVKRASPRTIRN
jgi:MFS family permease